MPFKEIRNSLLIQCFSAFFIGLFLFLLVHNPELKKRLTTVEEINKETKEILNENEDGKKLDFVLLFIENYDFFIEGKLKSETLFSHSEFLHYLPSAPFFILFHQLRLPC